MVGVNVSGYGRLYFADSGTDDFAYGSTSVWRIGSRAMQDCEILEMGRVRRSRARFSERRHFFCDTQKDYSAMETLTIYLPSKGLVIKFCP